jgi:hypothetical protein
MLRPWNDIQGNGHSRIMLSYINRTLQCHMGFALIEVVIIVAITGFCLP